MEKVHKDIEVFCPKCDYHNVGSIEYVCPKCGGKLKFTRKTLRFLENISKVISFETNSAS